MKKIMLIDGNSIINRAFYALPVLTNKNGEYTNAVYGFLNIIFKFYDEEKPDYIAVSFDLPKPTFRHLKYEAYKSNRKFMPDELRPQIPLLKNLLTKMNIKIYEKEGFEADDILGTLAVLSENEGFYPVIISGDRDLLQICTDKIKVRIPKTKAGKTEVENYYAKDVVEKIGVTPIEYIDVKALMGDASDNIPGVPGIGEKTALKIIQEFGNIENAIKNAKNITPKKASENLTNFSQQAIMSKELATIFLSVPIKTNFVEEASAHNIYNENALDEIKKLEFKSLIPRFSANSEKPALIINNKYNKIETLEDLIKFSNTFSLEKLWAFHILISDDKAIGIGFSSEKNPGVFVCFNKDLTVEKGLEILKPMFESKTEKTTLDSKQASIFLNEFNINLNNVVFDSTLAAYIINSSKNSYNYEDIAHDFLNENFPSQIEILGKGKNKLNFESISVDILTNFVCNQSNVILRSYKIMDNILKENGQSDLYYNMELPLAQVLTDMEIFGIKINRDELIEFGKNLDESISSLTKNIYDIAGEPFNINSPQQLGIILFEKIGLKSIKKTKTGYSTAADILEKLTNKHPIIEKILDYRTLTKLKSTYVDGLLNVINPRTGKIHSTFNQTITSTGRISSTEPNLQNIPIRLELGRKLRKVFIPSDETFLFLDGDYSQIELRILAHMSGDETLINAFNEGQDIHRLTASQVLKIPYDEVSAKERSNAKAVNFGIVYGIGGFSLSQDLNISKKEADSYIKGYFERYPKVKEYMDTTIENAKINGYAQTIFNRRRLIPELASSNFNLRSFGERVAMNMPIQGTAADIIKIAMINVHGRLKNEGLRSRLILQVHDELLLEVDRTEIGKAKEILKHEMEECVKLLVPLETDFHEGETWFDSK